MMEKFDKSKIPIFELVRNYELYEFKYAQSMLRHIEVRIGALSHHYKIHKRWIQCAYVTLYNFPLDVSLLYRAHNADYMSELDRVKEFIFYSAPLPLDPECPEPDNPYAVPFEDILEKKEDGKLYASIFIPDDITSPGYQYLKSQYEILLKLKVDNNGK